MKIIRDNAVFSMSSNNPSVETIKSGETLVFETKDCFNNQLVSEEQEIDALDWDYINPATGPVFIQDSQPGDVLKIRIQKIEVEEYGTMAAIPANGVLGDAVEKGQVKRIRVSDGVAYFNDNIHIPCNPMIGVIGVAPLESEIPCGEPGAHGGNMDNNKITAGSTLYLPVFHEGALLAMGDVHACMGDGEIMVTGLEIPAKITVTVELIKGLSINNPMLEDENACYTIASHQEIEQAILMATSDMTYVLMNKLNLSLNEAGMLLSAMGNLQFCQVVDPKRTVRMEMNKSVLKELV
jgi:amidase